MATFSLDGRGVWGRKDTCICMAESLHCSPITILLISYIPIENKKFKLKKKEIKKTPTSGRCQHSSCQRRPPEPRFKEQETHTMRPPETRFKEYRSLHTLNLSAIWPLNYCYKTHQILLCGTAQFLGQKPTLSPFAWQNNKTMLFYFKKKIAMFCNILSPNFSRIFVVIFII